MATLRSQQVPAMILVEIQSYSMDYLCDVIFSRPVAQKLFPDNVIVVEYFPIEPLRSSIDYLMQEEDLYFAVEKCTNDVPPRSVSFGVLSPRVKFMYWCATVYASALLLYEAHLLHQFKRALEAIKGPFIFCSLQDERFTDSGRKVLKELLHVTLDEERSKETMNIFEVNVTVQKSHI